MLSIRGEGGGRHASLGCKTPYFPYSHNFNRVGFSTQIVKTEIYVFCHADFHFWLRYVSIVHQRYRRTDRRMDRPAHVMLVAQARHALKLFRWLSADCMWVQQLKPWLENLCKYSLHVTGLPFQQNSILDRAFLQTSLEELTSLQRSPVGWGGAAPCPFPPLDYVSRCRSSKKNLHVSCLRNCSSEFLLSMYV